MGIFDFFKKGKYGGIPDTEVARFVNKILKPQYQKLENEVGKSRVHGIIATDYSFGYLFGMVEMTMQGKGKTDKDDMYATMERLIYLIFKFNGDQIFDLFMYKIDLNDPSFHAGHRDGMQIVYDAARSIHYNTPVEDFDWYRRVKARCI